MDHSPATPHWLDRPGMAQRLRRGLLVVIAVSVPAQWLVEMHPHFAIESLFGFAAWFGLIACAALIVVAKALALLLGRPASYYGAHDD